MQKMNLEVIMSELELLSKTQGWRALGELIEGGYKGLFVILRAVRDNEGAVSSGFLAKTVGVSTARVASALKTLEQKGYVTRERAKKDARCVIVKLTEQGACSLSRREKQIFSTLKPMFDKLPCEELQNFVGSLKKILS